MSEHIRVPKRALRNVSHIITYAREQINRGDSISTMKAKDALKTAEEIIRILLKESED